MASEKKFKPKYVAKVPIGKGKNRYFYTWPEYRAYKANKSTSTMKPINLQPTRVRTQPQNNRPVAAPYQTKYVATKKSYPAIKPTYTNAKKQATKPASTFDKIVSAGKSAVNKVLRKIGGIPASKAIVKTKPENKTDISPKVNPNTPYKFSEAINAARNVVKRVRETKAKIDSFFNKKKDTASASEDLESVNPNYGTNDRYAYNCTMCTMAYEMRRRGYDVEAVPSPVDAEGNAHGITRKDAAMVYQNVEVQNACDLFNGTPWPNHKNSEQFAFNSEKNGLDDLRDTYGVGNAKITKTIENELLKHGDGARGYLGVSWSGSLSGHALVWEIDDGRVVIKDPQNNTERALYGYVCRSRDIDYYRTDNVAFTDKIFDYVQNAEEVNDDDRAKRLQTSGY